MEFPQLNARCALPDCGQVDFLPFTCDNCKQTFCLEHRNNHAPCRDIVGGNVPVCPICSQPVPVIHGKDANRAVDEHIASGCTKIEASSVPKQVKCSKAGCKTMELIPIVCPKCNKGHCVPHRLPVDHNCASLEAKPAAKPPPPRAARPQFIQQKVTDFQSARSKKAAAQVALMKMKQNAKGDQKVPPELRFYLEVVYPMETKVTPKYLFFNQGWSVGKALDVAAAAGSIENRNNQPGAEMLRLFSLKTGLALPADLKLIDLHEVLGSGDAVLLEYEHAEVTVASPSVPAAGTV